MMAVSSDKLLDTLRCPGCQGHLSSESGTANADPSLRCLQCGERFPVVRGIPRLLLSPLREALLEEGSATSTDLEQVATARSFSFEWSHFPEMYDEWRRNFLSYMQPHGTDFFCGIKALDVGCGNGRFAYYAAEYGAEVWIMDLGAAVEVAQRNTARSDAVYVVQADLHSPPFAPESFDFIYSIGVLHHLPDPEAALQGLLRFLKPGCEIQIFLYWKPEGQAIKSALLAGVSAARKVTTRLPHKAVYAFSFPAALAAFIFFVWPYKALRRIPGCKALAERIMMKQYASLPFRVCVNDQFDRFSAPIEKRYYRAEVEDWLKRAGLEKINVKASYGWVATGRKPLASAVQPATEEDPSYEQVGR